MASTITIQPSFNQERSKRAIEPFPIIKLKLEALAYSELGPTRVRVRANEAYVFDNRAISRIMIIQREATKNPGPGPAL